MPYQPLTDQVMQELLAVARSLPPGVERVRAYQRIEDRILASAPSAIADEVDAGARSPTAIEAITLKNEIRQTVKRDLLGNVPPMVSFWLVVTGALMASMVTLWLLLNLFWLLRFDHLLMGR